jgi:hypothetical protein
MAVARWMLVSADYMLVRDEPYREDVRPYTGPRRPAFSDPGPGISAWVLDG